MFTDKLSMVFTADQKLFIVSTIKSGVESTRLIELNLQKAFNLAKLPNPGRINEIIKHFRDTKSIMRKRKLKKIQN